MGLYCIPREIRLESSDWLDACSSARWKWTYAIFYMQSGHAVSVQAWLQQ